MWQVKPRGPRGKISIPARMRSEEPITDVWIRNVSSRGMRIQADHPPRRGSYVELTLPNLEVVGRVVWTVGCNFGVHLTERIDIDALIKGLPPPPPRLANHGDRPEGLPERRGAARTEDQLARSRHIASLLQYGALTVFAVLAGFGILAVVHDVLSGTVAAISGHL